MFSDMVSGGVTSAITLSVLAPFIEEMLFRGLFLRSFLWNYSPAKVLVLSALLFGGAGGTHVVNTPEPQPHRAPAAPMHSARDAEFGLPPRHTGR